MNMSYCRFNNTNLALNECLNILEEPEGETISRAEKIQAKIMFRRFLEYCENSFVIDDYDIKVIDTLIDSFEE